MLILEHSCRELEVVAKCCVSIIVVHYQYILKWLKEAGIEAFEAHARKLRRRLHLSTRQE